MNAVVKASSCYLKAEATMAFDMVAALGVGIVGSGFAGCLKTKKANQIKYTRQLQGHC